MVQLALPLWLMVVLGLGLAVLLVGALYGLAVFMRQLVGGEVDFEGALPVHEFTLPDTDRPQSNPRLRRADPRLASDLMRQAEDERGPGGPR